MSFSVAMLALNAWAFLVALRLNVLEDSGFFSSGVFLVAMLSGMCVFALLTTAHAICLVLRATIWTDRRD